MTLLIINFIVLLITGIYLKYFDSKPDFGLRIEDIIETVIVFIVCLLLIPTILFIINLIVFIFSTTLLHGIILGVSFLILISMILFYLKLVKS